ncbi:MAG: hypothetical protein V4721_00315 [Bacteroidota bacterium]
MSKIAEDKTVAEMSNQIRIAIADNDLSYSTPQWIRRIIQMYQHEVDIEPKAAEPKLYDWQKEMIKSLEAIGSGKKIIQWPRSLGKRVMVGVDPAKAKSDITACWTDEAEGLFRFPERQPRWKFWLAKMFGKKATYGDASYWYKGALWIMNNSVLKTSSSEEAFKWRGNYAKKKRSSTKGN